MTDARLELIGRLAAVAEGLEREGGYNGAKLVRAAMERELVRVAVTGAPKDPEATAEAVRAIRDAAAGGDTRLAAALDAIAEAAAVGGTPTLEDAPRAWTCRTCGYLALGPELPEACPDCEASDVSFKEHPPVWFLEPAEPSGILAAMAVTTARPRRPLTSPATRPRTRPSSSLRPRVASPAARSEVVADRRGLDKGRATNGKGRGDA